MKRDIHPEYREVLFHDTSVDQYFLIPSTIQTDQTKEWEDGNKTAGSHAAIVKNNLQLNRNTQVSKNIAQLVN